MTELPSSSLHRNLPTAGLGHAWVNDPPVNNIPDLLAGALKEDIVEVTLDGGGDLADVELVPAMAGYFGVLCIHHIRAAFTDPSVDFEFQDEDNTILLGGGPYDLAFTIDQVNEDIHGTLMRIAAKTVNKALEVDITNGANNGRIDVHFFYHYERP